MHKPFQSILSTSRKRRDWAVSIALWLLCLVRDIEKNILRQYTDKLDKIDFEAGSASRREYAAIEDDCSDCECALGYLDCAIEDLEFAYEERF